MGDNPVPRVVEGLQGLLFEIDEAEIVVQEADDPNAVGIQMLMQWQTRPREARIGNPRFPPREQSLEHQLGLNRLEGGGRGFESVFLHRRVCPTSAFHGCSRKDPAFVYCPRSRSDIQADLRNVRERTAWPLRHSADLRYKRMA